MNLSVEPQTMERWSPITYDIYLFFVKIVAEKCKNEIGFSSYTNDYCIRYSLSLNSSLLLCIVNELQLFLPIYKLLPTT